MSDSNQQNPNQNAPSTDGQVKNVHPVKEQPTAAKMAAHEQSVKPRVSDDDSRDVLIRSLLEREARMAKKEIADEEAVLARGKQRALNTKNRNEKVFIKQQRCTHLKGGKIKSKTGIKDYALFHHTYIDKTQTIGCFICKMRWKPGDTKEALLRSGRRIRNHTKIGWLEANELFGQSSNTPSMSEIPQTFAAIEEVDDDDLEPAEAQ